MFSRLFIFAVCIAVPSVWALEDGAPVTACEHMVPQHQVSEQDKTPIKPQRSAAPYKLVLSKTSVKAGESVEVELKGNGAADSFQGFLVEAQVNDKPVGEFKVAAGNKLAKTLDCGTAKNNAVTHQKIENGVKSVKFTWTAPSSPGSVKFIATVGKDHATFWVQKVSASLKVE